MLLIYSFSGECCKPIVQVMLMQYFNYISSTVTVSSPRILMNFVSFGQFYLNFKIILKVKC